MVSLPNTRIPWMEYYPPWNDFSPDWIENNPGWIVFIPLRKNIYWRGWDSGVGGDPHQRRAKAKSSRSYHEIWIKKSEFDWIIEINNPWTMKSWVFESTLPYPRSCMSKNNYKKALFKVCVLRLVKINVQKISQFCSTMLIYKIDS